MSPAGRRARYLAAAPALLAAASGGGIIYTSDLPWIRVIAVLKHAGLLRNRVVAHWGGIDFEPERLGDKAYLRSFESLFSALDVVWLASENERRIWAGALPHLEKRMSFRPMFLDLGYYGRIAAGPSSFDVVAMGSDSRRDWTIPLMLAAQGLKVALLTEDRLVSERVTRLPEPVARNVTLVFCAGFERSAQIAAAAKCLLVSTLPNFRFSGSTTVAVASALGRPLVIDDPHDLAAYGLRPGESCEAFNRGDVGSALAAVRRVLDSPAHAQALGKSIGELRTTFDIERYVDALAASFLPDWRREPVKLQVQARPAV